MNIGHILKRLLLLAVALAYLAAHYVGVVRPSVLNWGATAEERVAPLPGDEIVSDSPGQSTRAITIDAPVEIVWPWLAQIGQDRGGFYSFDLLENLVGSEMPTADVLQPDKQHWKLGDKLWMYPSQKAGGAGHATLRVAIPGRALAFATRKVGTPLDRTEDGSWAFVAEPIDAAHTRLLLRGRGSPRHTMLGAGFDILIFEPIHFVMERRMMIGLKQLVETGARDRRSNHLHVILWLVTFVMLIVAAFRTLRRPRWIRPLVTFVTVAATFETLTLLQPPLGFGAAAITALLALLFLERRKNTQRWIGRELFPMALRDSSRTTAGV